MCVAGGGCFVNGCLLGFTATAGISIDSNKSKDVYGQQWKATMQDLSWIGTYTCIHVCPLSQDGSNSKRNFAPFPLTVAASLLFLGCFVGHLVSMPMLDKLGRKLLLGPICGSLFVAANALVFLAGNAYLVMAGRFAGGVAMGIQLSAASAYISEVTKSDVRGAAGYAGTQLAGSLGAAATTWMGAAVSPRWWSLPLLAMAVAVPSAVAAALWAPESPRWLLQRGREYSAVKSLEWLRGRNEEDVDT